MDCPNCRAELSAERDTCPQCGAAVARICAGCDAALLPQSRFCHLCGHPVDHASPSAPGQNAMLGVFAPSPEVTVQRRGERRQVTIMFCDLVDSTALARALDPEDLREVYRVFRDAVVAVIRNHDGFVASFLGDGIVAFFGYPSAREDDAERGVRAGLEVLAALRDIRPLSDVTLQARIGITTGLVVLGDLAGDGAPREKAAVGEATNLAARLQGEAEPGSLLISDSTRRLIGNLLECVDGGSRRMKGYQEPVQVWKVLRERPVEDRFEAIHATTSLAPLFGRASRKVQE